MPRLNVGEFMRLLKQMPQDEPVKYDFVHFGPTTVQSYRGFYEDIALGYGCAGTMIGSVMYEYPTVQQLLRHFKCSMGRVFEGWKGGNSTPMHPQSLLWVANPGETGSTVITDVQLRLYVTIVTCNEDSERTAQ